MSLGRFSSRLVFALWWLAKLADSFKESTFSVSVAIWCCSCNNCLSVLVSTERETGGLIGVELWILYDCRELERLSGGEIVNDVPSKSEPRLLSNCKSRRVLECRFSVPFLSTKTRGRSCPRGTIACQRAEQINHAINSKSKWSREREKNRTLTWQEHWIYSATILLSRRCVQRIIAPKILRIVRAVHFKLQQIITSQVLDKLDERRINLQKQNANPNDRNPVLKTCDVWCDVTQTKVTPTLPRNMIMSISIISLAEKTSHDACDVSFSFHAALSVRRSFEGRTSKSCILVLPQHGKEKVFL